MPNETNLPEEPPKDRPADEAAPGAGQEGQADQDAAKDAPGPGAPNSGVDTPAASEGAAEQSELAALQADLEKFRDLALRTQADFENFRKRSAREREEAVRYANAALLEELLPVIDSFELGMAAASSDPAAAAIVQGFGMVQKQLNDFLRAQGAEPLDAAPGEVFDPKIHEALGQENSDAFAEGAVIRQVRRGWKLKDRLLRPASVFVSRGPDGEAASSGE